MCIVSLKWRYGDRYVSNWDNTEQYFYPLKLGHNASIENYLSDLDL